MILLRGSHEDSNININYGLSEECEVRLKDNIRSPNSVFLKINTVFEYLPLAALIDNKILCCHGGIGSGINKVAEISSIKKPIQVIQEVTLPEHQIILDLLWSEYTDTVNELIVNDEREVNKGGFIVKFGKERLFKFLHDNNLAMIVSSHMWIAEGVKKFANDKLISVFSATNYGDRAGNLGGILVINKYATSINPKLIDIWKGDKKAYKNVKDLSPTKK